MRASRGLWKSVTVRGCPITIGRASGGPTIDKRVSRNRNDKQNKEIIRQGSIIGTEGQRRTIRHRTETGGTRSHMKAIGGLSDYTLVSESLTNMEGKRHHRPPARASQTLRLLGVTSSRYRMGLQASNSSRAGQGA